MKLDTETLDVLKNFSTINPSLMIKPGDTLKTISLSNSVIAKAKLKQKFNSQFAIYDLPSFLSAVSMFENANLDFEDDRFVVLTNEDGSASVRYFFADAETVISPPEREMPVPTTDIKFTLTKEMLDGILKAASILDLPELAFIGNGKNISVQAIKPSDVSSNLYKREIADSSQEFSAYFKKENIKLFPNDYNVSIGVPKKKGDPGIAHFAATGVEYWVVVEHHSTF